MILKPYSNDESILAEMQFHDEGHKERYVSYLQRMGKNDSERAAFAYLIALTNAPINDCYDFELDEIKPEAVDCSWATGTDARVLALAFNLFNCFYYTADVSDVFSYPDWEYVQYMFFAIRIRFCCTRFYLAK